MNAPPPGPSNPYGQGRPFEPGHYSPLTPVVYSDK